MQEDDPIVVEGDGVEIGDLDIQAKDDLSDLKCDLQALLRRMAGPAPLQGYCSCCSSPC